jgi:hypothetical protein
MFEVSKADDEEKPTSSTEDSSGQKMTSSTQSSSALRVTIPTELQGVAYIMVLCQKGTFLLVFVPQVYSHFNLNAAIFRQRKVIQYFVQFAEFDICSFESRLDVAAKVGSRAECTIL